MKLASAITLAVITCTLEWKSEAQVYYTNNVFVSTFAGSGSIGHSDGQGLSATFNSPSWIVADAFSNLFVLDYDNLELRKITPAGYVSTYADLSQYTSFYGLAIDSSNNLWTSTGQVLLLVQPGGTASPIAVPASCFSSSLPDYIYGVCVDSRDSVYFSTAQGKIYRRFTNGSVELFAGGGPNGGEAIDGRAGLAVFGGPRVQAADSADNIYVVDFNRIRKIDQEKYVLTIATNYPPGPSIVVPDNNGNLICSFDGNIQQLTPATNFIIIAGQTDAIGYADGPGSTALFSQYLGVCFTGNRIFVSEQLNQRIRQITFNSTPQPVLPADLKLNTYPGLQITGTVGHTYQVQASADTTNWNTVATLPLTSSPYLWIDESPVQGNRFYRAFMLP